MSISLKKILDPRLAVEQERLWVIPVGPSIVTTTSYNCDSVSESQLKWSIVTPSLEDGFDRKVIIDSVWEIYDSLGTAPEPLNFGNTSVGIRQWPVHSVTTNLQSRLNGYTTSWEPQELIHSLTSYGNDENDRQYYMSATPHKPDFYYSYNTAGMGQDRNPFSSYLDSGFEDSRGLSVWLEPNVVANRLQVRVREHLMISPFNWGPKDYAALFGVRTFDLTLALGNNRRFIAGTPNGWAGSPGSIFPTAAFANLKCAPVLNNTSAHTLHLTFITKQPDMSIPNLINYPYYECIKYPQSMPSLAVNALPVSVQFNNVSLTHMPSRIYIYAKPSLNNASTVEIPDTHLAIDDITMTLANRTGRLSSLDSYDLHRISAKNGFHRSFVAWNKFYGSVLCLVPGMDLDLSPLLAPGVDGYYQFNFKVSLRDLRKSFVAGIDPPNVLAYTLMLVTVNDGVMTINNATVDANIGGLTEMDVEATKDYLNPGIRMETLDYSGGLSFSDIWSGIKKGFKSVAPVVATVADIAGDVASAIPHPAARGIGVGSKVLSSVLKKTAGRKTARGGARLRASSLARRC